MLDGIKVFGEIVGVDIFFDIVVVKIFLEKVIIVVEFGDFSKLIVGEIVIVIGSLLGFEYVNIVI